MTNDETMIEWRMTKWRNRFWFRASSFLRHSSFGFRHSSFIPQRYHWIDFHGASGRNITGKPRGHDEQANDAGVGHYIRGADSVKHGGEQTRETNRSENSHSHAGQNQSEALAENHPQH